MVFQLCQKILQTKNKVNAYCPLIFFAALIMIGLSDNVVMAQNRKQEIQLSDEAKRQIAAALYDKETLNPSQQKISTQLLLALKQLPGNELQSEKNQDYSKEIDLDSNENVLIDVRARVTPKLLKLIKKLKGTIIYSSPQHQRIRSRIALNKLETLAASADVQFIECAAQAITNNQR